MQKKGLALYWDHIDLPVIIFVVYAVLGVIFPLTDWLGTTLASIIGILVMIFVFGFAGFRIAKSKEQDLHAAKAGAWAGAIIGLVSAIIGLIVFYFFPERISAVINKAAQAGANVATIQTFIKIGLFIDLVIYPAIYGAIGALITWVSSLIFKSQKSSSDKDKEWIKKK